MAEKTKIEWTESTWNPVTGCTKISPGCENCYAERISKKFAGKFGYPQDDPFRVSLHRNRIDQPSRWNQPKKIFVCSMGDLFHKDVPFEFIDQVFYTIKVCRHHAFLILTKRPERMSDYVIGRHKAKFPFVFPLGFNVYLGVTAENQKAADERIPTLLKIGAYKRFVSIEPMLEHINLDKYIDGLDWVIVGGESGSNARPMRPEWAMSIRDVCLQHNVPFFFKQWGGSSKDKGGRLLDGQEWNETIETDGQIIGDNLE